MKKKGRKGSQKDPWDDMNPLELARCEALTIGGYTMDILPLTYLAHEKSDGSYKEAQVNPKSRTNRRRLKR